MIQVTQRATEQANATYLGYPLTITNRTVTVHAPDGREIGVAYELSGARRIVKGHRGYGREKGHA